MPVTSPQQLTPVMRARIYHILCYVRDKGDGVRAGDMRKEIGASSKTSTVSQGFMHAENMGYLKAEHIAPTVKVFNLTKKGLKYIEENEGQVTTSVEDAFIPAYVSKAKEPVEQPRTESESAAVEGIANLIDENRRLRAALVRMKHEIEALLS